ncbi:hAT transposon family protein, partial [Mycobacterium kansasii]
MGVEESRDADISVPGNPDVLNECISYLAQARMRVYTKESELEMYLKEPMVVRAEFDVLEWWKMRVSESKY